MEYHCFVIGLGTAGIRAVKSMMDKSRDVAPDFLELSYIAVDTEGDRLWEAKTEQRLNRFGCAAGRERARQCAGPWIAVPDARGAGF